LYEKIGGANSNNKPGKPPHIAKHGGLKPGFFGGLGSLPDPPLNFRGGAKPSQFHPLFAPMPLGDCNHKSIVENQIKTCLV